MHEWITGWDGFTTHQQQLMDEINRLQNSLVTNQARVMNEYETLLLARTKQQIEGKEVSMADELKYHFIVGELDEWQRMKSQIDDLVDTLTRIVEDVPVKCVWFAQVQAENATAHAIHLFFIDTFIQPAERETQGKLRTLERMKNAYLEEQLPLSIRLLTHNVTLEEQQVIQAKQALLTGKLAQVQNAIRTIEQHWNALHGTSISSLLTDWRLALYHHVDRYQKKETCKN